MAVSSTEDTLSTLYNVSEPDLLDVCASLPVLRWARTPRREAEYIAGQPTAERTKQYLREVNCTITRLQESGIHIHIIEAQLEQSIIDRDLEGDLVFIGAWTLDGASDEASVGEIFWSEDIWE